MFYILLLYVYSYFAIILMGNRELVALLSLSSWCPVIVVWLFLSVPCVGQFVIVIFPDHNHILFLGVIHTNSDGFGESAQLHRLTIALVTVQNLLCCLQWRFVCY